MISHLTPGCTCQHKPGHPCDRDCLVHSPEWAELAELEALNVTPETRAERARAGYGTGA